MQSLILHARVGNDGILKLETPIGITNADLEVILVVNPVDKSQHAHAWPAFFFNEVVGGWKGARLVRESQGSYETRSDLK